MKHKWNKSLTVCRKNAISHSRPLPIKFDTSQRFLWMVLLDRRGFDFNHDTVEIGFGYPNEEGAADKSKNCFVTEMEVLPNEVTCNFTPATARAAVRHNSARYPERLTAGFHARLWANSRGFRRVVLDNHGFDVSYQRLGECLGVEGGVYPILVLKTKYGAINLIPSAEKPSLQALCSREIAKSITKFESINLLILSPACREQLQKEWIRHHKTIVISQ